MAAQTYLAVDLGASGGRVLTGHFDGKKLSLEEVHRFANGGVHVGSRLQWDVLGLWQHVQDGLRSAADRFGSSIQSVGVDTWGVDFALLGSGDELLGNPYHYRDARTDGVLEKAFSIVPREEIFAATGMQFMQFNTLFQLLVMRQQDSVLLNAAETLLMMPDVFHWLLTGEKVVEETDASTSQLVDPRNKQWSRDLIGRFDLPARIFGPTAAPATRLGKLLPQVAQLTNLADVEVVLPGTHDTASAVVAVPASSPVAAQPNWCYISSGTWSLMGVEVPAPVITDQCAAFNFTNEGGVGGTTRLLKNIAGLWLLQECRRIWAIGGKNYSWDELVEMAEAAPSHAAFIQPDDPRLAAPQDMPATIAELCRESGQTPPDSPGGIIRCALESLALRYRQVLGMLEQLTGGCIETIHIVGGGSQNALLSQMAADACGRTVITGPVEATAIGNVLVQCMAAGEIESIEQAREVVRNSFDTQTYSPTSNDAWTVVAERFDRMFPPHV